MKVTKRMLVIFMLVLFAVASVSGTAMAAKILKLHHLNKDDPFDNPTGAMATVFKSLVEAGTNGSVLVQTFPSGQLGKDKDALQQVKAGVIQAGIHSVGGFASVYPLIGILDIPFAFTNISKTYEVFDGPFGAKLGGDINKKTGLHVLGFGDSGGFFHLTNSKRPIHKPADLKGLKIRVMESPVYLDTFKQLGVQPVPMPFPEVYNALQQGVIDGQDNPLLTSVLMKFTEVNKYVTITHHILTECPIVVNPDFWKTLSNKQKKIMREAAVVCIKTNRKVNASLYKNKIWKVVKAKHIKVVKLTPAERAAFKKAMVPVYKKYKKIVGPNLFNLFEKKIKYYSTH